MERSDNEGVTVNHPSLELVFGARKALKDQADNRPFADKVVVVDYTNYRGDRAWRLLSPHNFTFAKTQYHPRDQFLFAAFDLIKGEERTFAMEGVHAWLSIEDFVKKYDL